MRFFIHLRMDCRTVCGGIDDSCCAVGAGVDDSCRAVGAGIDDSCRAVGAGIDGSCRVANCLGAPLVGARGFLGLRPLLFGMKSSIIEKSGVFSNTQKPLSPADNAQGPPCWVGRAWRQDQA